MKSCLFFLLLISSICAEDNLIWVEIRYVAGQDQKAWWISGQVDQDVVRKLSLTTIDAQFIKLSNCRYWSNKRDRYCEYSEDNLTGEILIQINSIINLKIRSSDILLENNETEKDPLAIP